MVVRGKEEAENVMFWLDKEISKVKNTLLQCILQSILENQTFQRIAKFITADFYEMDLIKGIVTLVKVDEMCNIFKSASQCLLVERWDGNGSPANGSFAGDIPIRLLYPSFNKGQTSSRKRYSCRERSWYCNIDDTEIR